MVQKLRFFSFSISVHVVRLARHINLIIIEHTCKFINVMAKGTYCDYIKDNISAPNMGQFSTFIIFRICPFIISELCICIC
jgi:hypothetical protein